MKNVRSPSAKRGRRHQGVFHRPSEPNPDFETLLSFFAGTPSKSLDGLLQMGDEKLHLGRRPHVARAFRAFFITLLG
jgi:hypothetical protein